MPSPTLAQIMDELADTIRNVTDQVTDVNVQVEPRFVLNPTPPTVDLYPADPSNDAELEAFGEAWETGAELITVRIRVDTADSAEGQGLLLALMDDVDALSVGLAITDDPTLNGLASSVEIKNRSGFVTFPSFHHDGYFLGCLFLVEIVKRRS